MRRSRIDKGNAILAAVTAMVMLLAASSFAPESYGGSIFGKEHEIKAALLYKIGKFVQWPDDTFKTDEEPYVVCVLGDDLIFQAMETIQGKTIRGRPLTIKQCDEVDATGSCHIVFVSGSLKDRLPEVLGQLRNKTILTVSDIRGFAEEGGVISFVLSKDKVRFEINVDAVDRAGLKVSSKVLSLAKVVRDK